MEQQQELHLEYIKKEAVDRLDKKYRAGQAEHGGDLQDLTITQLLDEAISETIDQLTYLLTLKDKIEDMKSKIQNMDAVERIPVIKENLYGAYKEHTDTADGVAQSGMGSSEIGAAPEV